MPHTHDALFDSIASYSAAWYAAPTSVMLMHLVGHSGSHVPIESLWQAVLGVTDQFQRGNVPEISYNSYCDELKVGVRH